MIFNDYLNCFLIFSWKDILEIFFFTSIIYYCSKWLKSDKQKNLLINFYLFLSFFVFSSLAQMPTITNFLIAFFPVILVFFFLAHQRTIQKNLVSTYKIQTNKNIPDIWINDFMRCCLNAMANNKQITCVIEGKNSLYEFIKIPFLISSEFNKDLIDILINSQNFDQQKMIWVSFKGIINSINAVWNIKNPELWMNPESQIVDQWQQDAIIFTSKTDCIIFRTYPSKRTIDIVIQGRLIEDLSANNALNLVIQFIKKNEIKNIKKDLYNNEIKNKNDSFKQPFA